MEKDTQPMIDCRSYISLDKLKASAFATDPLGRYPFNQLYESDDFKKMPDLIKQSALVFYTAGVPSIPEESTPEVVLYPSYSPEEIADDDTVSSTRVGQYKNGKTVIVKEKPLSSMCFPRMMKYQQMMNVAKIGFNSDIYFSMKGFMIAADYNEGSPASKVKFDPSDYELDQFRDIVIYSASLFWAIFGNPLWADRYPYCTLSTELLDLSSGSSSEENYNCRSVNSLPDDVDGCSSAILLWRSFMNIALMSADAKFGFSPSIVNKAIADIDIPNLILNNSFLRSHALELHLRDMPDGNIVVRFGKRRMFESDPKISGFSGAVAGFLLTNHSTNIHYLSAEGNYIKHKLMDEVKSDLFSMSILL